MVLNHRSHPVGVNHVVLPPPLAAYLSLGPFLPLNPEAADGCRLQRTRRGRRLLTGSVNPESARPDGNWANLLLSRGGAEFAATSPATREPAAGLRPRWRSDKASVADTAAAPRGRWPRSPEGEAVAPPTGGFISELNTSGPNGSLFIFTISFLPSCKQTLSKTCA